MKMRSISVEFQKELKTGSLSKLLKYVLKDDTLCLELRGDFINIYYRGGRLFKIDNKFNLTFDTKYENIENKDKIENEDKKLNPNPDIEEAVNNIPFYKKTMDRWFNENPRYEREFQQIILRENNNSGNISRATDYYITDIEYQDSGNNSRFDMVAFKWLSNGAVRKNTNALSLAFIEVKYGDNAMGGSSGIKKHLDDLKTFINDKEKLDKFKKDMEQVFTQKCELGLMDGLNKNQFEISLSDDEPEVIFILANHDPDSKRLNNILSEINVSDYPFKILIAQSSFMGYGLYADNMIPLEKFLS